MLDSRTQKEDQASAPQPVPVVGSVVRQVKCSGARLGSTELDLVPSTQPAWNDPSTASDLVCMDTVYAISDRQSPQLGRSFLVEPAARCRTPETAWRAGSIESTRRSLRQDGLVGAAMVSRLISGSTRRRRPGARHPVVLKSPRFTPCRGARLAACVLTGSSARQAPERGLPRSKRRRMILCRIRPF